MKNYEKQYWELLTLHFFKKILRSIFNNIIRFIVQNPGTVLHRTILVNFFNPHMHKIFLQLYCMKWVPKDAPKEMLN